MACLTVLLASMVSVVASVDDAIALYENGDIPGAIDALSVLVRGDGLSYDEQLRAWDRLGSAYFAMGDIPSASEAYLELLKLDVHYDLNPLANPRLRDLLGQVRVESMATAMVTTQPEGALVTLDSELLGVTPMVLEGLLDGQEYEISLYANGYRSESIRLVAQAGHNHDLQISLSEIESGIDVAMLQSDTASTTQIQQTGLAGILGTQTAQSSGQGAGTQGGTPVSTADLVNILTSSGGGFDMAALASSGALSSQRPADSLAGGQRVTGSALTTGQAIPTLASTDVQSMMVFSDASSGGQAAGSGELPGSSRTSEEIMGVLTEKRGSITYIYNKHLRSDPMLMGTVVIEMVIEPSGRVSDVRVVQSDTYNPAFELELARTIETWRFGSVDEDEGPVTVQYPFSFSQ